MTRDSRRLGWMLAAGGIVVLLAAAALLWPRGEEAARSAEATTVYVRWQAPTTGAAAVRYVVRVQDLESAAEDTFQVAARPGVAQSFAFTRARPGREYRASIAGVDAQDRQGSWSDWSPVYRREAAAGVP